MERPAEKLAYFPLRSFFVIGTTLRINAEILPGSPSRQHNLRLSCFCNQALGVPSIPENLCAQQTKKLDVLDLSYHDLDEFDLLFNRHLCVNLHLSAN